MTNETLYAFTDRSGEHVLNVGPGGWGWTRIDSPLAEVETFVICGDDNARDFQQWHKNWGLHIRRVAVGDVIGPVAERSIWINLLAGTRPRNEVTQ